MMMVPEAYRDRDRPARASSSGFYDYHSCAHGAVGRPGGRGLHRRPQLGATLDRNGLRPGRWVHDTRRLGRARLRDGRRHGRAERDRRARAACSRASCSSSTSSRAGIVERRARSSAQVAAPAPVRRVVRRARRQPRRPARARAARAARRAAALQAARVRLLAGGPADDASRRWRRDGEEPTGSMGNDLALAVLSDRQPPLFSLLQAAVRPGHQPADRPGARVDRDEPRTRASAPRCNLLAESPEHAHQLVMRQPILTQPRAREAAPGLARRRSTRATIDITWPIDARPRRAWSRALERDLRTRPSQRGRARRATSSILSRPQRRRRARRDPVAARGRRRPPPPRARGHAPAGRPRDRVGRAARDPPHGDADRLRRGGDQPVPDVRVARRARPIAACCPIDLDSETPSSGSSRRSARAC